MKIWFYEKNSNIAREHRLAYEKSLNSDRPVKVHAGEYYYKGYNISNDGGNEYPWNYQHPTEISGSSAATKNEAMRYIDDIIKFDLCDIICK